MLIYLQAETPPSPELFFDEDENAEDHSAEPESHDEYFSRVLQPLIDERLDGTETEYDPDNASGREIQTEHPSFVESERAGTAIFDSAIDLLKSAPPEDKEANCTANYHKDQGKLRYPRAKTIAMLGETGMGMSFKRPLFSTVRS